MVVGHHTAVSSTPTSTSPSEHGIAYEKNTGRAEMCGFLFIFLLKYCYTKWNATAISV